MGCLRFCSLLGSIPGFRGNLEVREVPVAAGSCTRGCPWSYVDVLPKDLLLRDPEGWVQSPRCGQGWLLLSPVPWLAPSCLLNELLQLCNCLFCLFLVGERWSVFVCVWGEDSCELCTCARVNVKRQLHGCWVCPSILMRFPGCQHAWQVPLPEETSCHTHDTS